MSRNPLLILTGISDVFLSFRRKKNDKWMWLSKLTKDNINLIIGSMLIGFFMTILGFSTAIFSQILIDDLLPAGNQDHLRIGFVLLFLSLTLRSGLAYIRRNFLFSQNKRINNKILPLFLSLTLHLPRSFFDLHSTPELGSGLLEHQGLQKIFSYLTDLLFMDLLLVLSTTACLAWYSTSIAAVLLTGVLLLLFLSFNFKRPKANQLDLTGSNDAEQGEYLNIFRNIKAIKAHHAEDHFIAKNEEFRSSLQQKKELFWRSKNKSMMIADLVSVAFGLILTGLSCVMLLRHTLKTGEMVAIIIMSISLIPAIRRVSQIRTKLEEFSLAVEKIYNFSCLKPEYPPQEKTELQSINFQSLKVKGLSFSFPDCPPLLRDISLRVSAGECIALLGEPGSGKSTIFAILQKHYASQSGLITLNEQCISHVSTPSLRNMMATVPQEVKIFDGTLMENIAMGSPQQSPSSIIEFCIDTGFHQFFQSLPQGYLTQIGETKFKLSSGQKQLIGIARALYRKPQLLLLDEVTAFMDTHTERFILELLASFKGRIAIILITHKTETTRLADRIYVIRQGQLEDPYRFFSFSS